MALTRTQARDYIRAICGEQDFANLKDTLVNQFINFGIRQVQNDLMSLGMKVFVKQKTLSGSVVAVPSDCLALPNAIIDIKASTGTRSYGTQAFSVGSGSVTITVIEPGNSEWIVTYVNDSGYTTPAVTAYDIALKTVTIKMQTGATSGTMLTTLATTNPVLSTYLSFSYSVTSAITLGASSIAVATTTATGTGTGWQPAEECSIEDWNRLSSNTYLAPTTTNIIYKRNGDYNGAGTIEFLPTSVTYAYIYYFYKLADLTSDSSSLPFPDEYEELLLTAVAIKCYSRLKFMAGVSEKAQEYLTKLQSLNNDYKNLLNDRVADKTRLLSDDPKD